MVKYRPTDGKGMVPGVEMDRVTVWIKELESSDRAEDMDRTYIYQPEDDLYEISSISLGLHNH